jgi:Lon protease-like protein
VTHVPAEGGGQNILLLGLHRIAIQAELPPQRAYREATVELLSDRHAPSDTDNLLELQRDLLDAFRDFVPESVTANEQFQQLLSSDIPLGTLTDIVAFTIDLPMATKQRLLGQLDVTRRARRLLRELHELQAGTRDRPFPPPFSDN